jgi:hypothetical protein
MFRKRFVSDCNKKCLSDESLLSMISEKNAMMLSKLWFALLMFKFTLDEYVAIFEFKRKWRLEGELSLLLLLLFMFVMMFDSKTFSEESSSALPML